MMRQIRNCGRRVPDAARALRRHFAAGWLFLRELHRRPSNTSGSTIHPPGASTARA
jgi:hypothetical protein